MHAYMDYYIKISGCDPTAILQLNAGDDVLAIGTKELLKFRAWLKLNVPEERDFDSLLKFAG